MKCALLYFRLLCYRKFSIEPFLAVFNKTRAVFNKTRGALQTVKSVLVYSKTLVFEADCDLVVQMWLKTRIILFSDF